MNTKVIIENIKRFILTLFLVFPVSRIFANNQMSCPKIADSNLPALLFVEGTVDHSNLYVAYLDGCNLRKKKIISSKYLQVIQLDNAIFLISAQQDSRKGEIYVIDLIKGIGRHLATSTKIHCLRTDPENRRAMLIEPYMDICKICLMELNLDTFDMELKYTLTREHLGSDFEGLSPIVKISPNFQYIAYVSIIGKPQAGRYSKYNLRVLDLSTMQVVDIDRDVCVQLSPVSSVFPGRPPFEWINNSEVIYQNIIPNIPSDPNDYYMCFKALTLLKSCNIKTKEISEVLRRSLPLTISGGSLINDPLRGNLVYNGQWILDLKNKTLIRKDSKFSVSTDSSTKETQILDGKNVVYRGKKEFIRICVSISDKNFAYSLRPKSQDLNVVLYAKFKKFDKPVKVAGGSYLPTEPVAWIE